MEGENEITVVVEDRAAAVEADIALAEIHAEREIAVATVQAEAAVEIAQAQATVIDHVPPAWAAGLVSEVTALRSEVAALRAEKIVEDIVEEIKDEDEDEDEDGDDEVPAIESGEIPASVPAAEALEPSPIDESFTQEKTRKRHFVSL